jgi:hypothetical protein
MTHLSLVLRHDSGLACVVVGVLSCGFVALGVREGV